MAGDGFNFDCLGNQDEQARWVRMAGGKVYGVRPLVYSLPKGSPPFPWELDSVAVSPCEGRINSLLYSLEIALRVDRVIVPSEVVPHPKGRGVLVVGRNGSALPVAFRKGAPVIPDEAMFWCYEGEDDIDANWKAFPEYFDQAKKDGEALDANAKRLRWRDYNRPPFPPSIPMGQRRAASVRKKPTNRKKEMRAS